MSPWWYGNHDAEAWWAKESKRQEHEWDKWSGIRKTRQQLTEQEIQEADTINDQQCQRMHDARLKFQKETCNA